MNPIELVKPILEFITSLLDIIKSLKNGKEISFDQKIKLASTILVVIITLTASFWLMLGLNKSCEIQFTSEKILLDGNDTYPYQIEIPILISTDGCKYVINDKVIVKSLKIDSRYLKESITKPELQIINSYINQIILDETKKEAELLIIGELHHAIFDSDYRGLNFHEKIGEVSFEFQVRNGKEIIKKVLTKDILFTFNF